MCLNFVQLAALDLFGKITMNNAIDIYGFIISNN